jgi:hypothetical protein
MVLADGSGGRFAGMTAFVVGRGSQFMLDNGVEQHKFVPLGSNGIVFVLQ